VALHQNRDVEPLQLRDGVDPRTARGDGVDFVQKRKDRPDAELVDVPALRGAVLLQRVALRSTVLHCAAT
jgi:hypothetical protein